MESLLHAIHAAWAGEEGEQGKEMQEEEKKGEKDVTGSEHEGEQARNTLQDVNTCIAQHSTA